MDWTTARRRQTVLPWPDGEAGQEFIVDLEVLPLAMIWPRSRAVNGFLGVEAETQSRREALPS